MWNKLQQRKGQEGFTIIEVLIVLAIAGLIMVVVFLAIPSLQRAQRNNSRKTDANNSISALNDYTSNNGGVLPASGCTGTACTFLTNAKFGYYQAGNVQYFATFASFTGTAPDSEHMYLIAGATCATAAGTPSAATSARSVAAYYGIEGNVATQCIAQ
jgi:prepilin-type N-terminal cleavage/methylation domain-containing protein